MSVLGGTEVRAGQAPLADQAQIGASSGLVALRSPAGVALVAATVLASAVTFLDANVINVAVPAIGRALHASLSPLQWILTGYLLTAAALLLLSGALADHFGRRRVLSAGLLVMLVASVLCAVAPSMSALIAARVIQGIGAAMVVPSSLSLLNGTLRVADRARGIGIWAGLATIGTTVGPYAGGWLVDHVSWRAVFLLNVPLIVAGLLVLRRVPERDDARRPLSLDAAGGLLAVIGLGGVIYALTAGPSSGWLSGRILLAAAIGVLSLAALVPAERRLTAPMLRLPLFRSRQFDAINVATALFYGAGSAAAYLLILECELRLGYSAAQAGAALIPNSAVFLVIAPISGVLVARVGSRWLMVAGMLTNVAAFIWLSQAHPGVHYVDAILPGALLWGLGLGLAVSPLTATVLAAVKDVDLGEASAINDASSRVGGLIAIATVPALIGAAGPSLAHALPHGYQSAMIVMAGLCAAGALITALFVSSHRTAAPALAPDPRTHACALPVSKPARCPEPRPTPTIGGTMTTESVSVARAPALLGQTVVLIGGSAGIGLETARLARAEGADVILTGRTHERLEHAAREIGARSTFAFDATDPAAVARFFDALPGRIDHILVTGPGPSYGPLLEMTAEQVRDALADHVVLGLDVARNAAPKMRPGGTLLLMGGTGGRRIRRELGLVSAATAVLPPFVAALALELAPVRVNLIAAGFVDTPLSASYFSEEGLEARREELRTTLPIARVVGPADVAALAVHIMTNTALTGGTYDIDGGQQFVS